MNNDFNNIYNSNDNTTTFNNTDIIMYSPAQVGKILGFGLTKTYQLFNTDGFPAIKIGHDFRIEKSKFEQWVSNYAGKEFYI